MGNNLLKILIIIRGVFSTLGHTEGQKFEICGIRAIDHRNLCRCHPQRYILFTYIFLCCHRNLEPKSGGLWTDLPGENDLPIPTYVDIFVARGHISANNLEFKPPRV